VKGSQQTTQQTFFATGHTGNAESKFTCFIAIDYFYPAILLQLAFFIRLTMSLRQFTAAAVLAFASLGLATKEVPAGIPTLGTDTVAGCFNALADMTLVATWEYNTQGWCSKQCRSKNKPVGATYSKACYCGTKLPNQKNLLNDSKCNEPCPGFGDQACTFLEGSEYVIYTN
jgi:cell wall integrity and stress response component